MPRFFFSLRKDGSLAADPEGSELPDLAAAQREAEMSLRELLANAIKSGDEDERLPDNLVVYDQDGREVHSLILEQVLPKQLQRTR